jgi:hypothetical protein
VPSGPGGGEPTSIANTTAPSENTSLRALGASPSASSGATKPANPRHSAPSAPWATALVSARPAAKSVRRIWPTSSMRMLRGWMAPWTMPRWCAAATPCATACPIAAATSGASLPPRSRTCARNSSRVMNRPGPTVTTATSPPPRATLTVGTTAGWSNEVRLDRQRSSASSAAKCASASRSGAISSARRSRRDAVWALNQVP